MMAGSRPGDWYRENNPATGRLKLVLVRIRARGYNTREIEIAVFQELFIYGTQ